MKAVKELLNGPYIGIFLCPLIRKTNLEKLRTKSDLKNRNFRNRNIETRLKKLPWHVLLIEMLQQLFYRSTCSDYSWVCFLLRTALQFPYQLCDYVLSCVHLCLTVVFYTLNASERKAGRFRVTIDVIVAKIKVSPSLLPPHASPWHPGGRRLEMIARRRSGDRWRRSPTPNNAGQTPCRCLVCSQSPPGGVGRAALPLGIAANCSWWQVPHVMERWGCRPLAADTTSRGPPARRVKSETDLFGGRAGVWCPLPGSSPLGAVITAECVSRRPALIGLSLSSRCRSGRGWPLWGCHGDWAI